MKALHTQPEPQAVTFVRKTIRLGPVEVDGFMLPSGEFRQGIGSTGRAIGRNHQRVSRVVSELMAAGAKALQGNESRSEKASTAAGGATAPVIKVVGRQESLLSLEFAQKIWSYEARHAVSDARKSLGTDDVRLDRLVAQAQASQEMAWQLVEMFMGVGLERSYQEAFGVQDSRSQEDRLLDFFIDWNIGPYRKLFDDQFQIQFKRVTGHDINSPSQHVKFIIANFLYNRLPAQVYEAIMELNPVGEDGRRHHKHHQLISDKAKLEVVLPLISSLKAFMVQAPSGNVRYVNEQMDRLHPTQRGPRQKTSHARYAQMSWC